MAVIDIQAKENHEQEKFKKLGNQTGVVTQDPNFVTYIESVNSTTTYIGIAEPGASTTTASWQIKRIEAGATTTIISWADGSREDDKKWSLRASYTYS